MNIYDLKNYFGNMANAAERLGVTRQAVYGWKRLGIPARHQAHAEFLSSGKLVPDPLNRPDAASEDRAFYDKLVAHYGGVKEAATALKVSRSSVAYWKIRGVPYEKQVLAARLTSGKLPPRILDTANIRDRKISFRVFRKLNRQSAKAWPK